MPTPTGLIAMTANTALALTTSPALVTGWSSTRPYSTYDDGDQSVQPDPTNSQILVHKPGVYEIEFLAQVYADGDQPAEFDLYVNGAAMNPPVSAEINFGDSHIRQVVLKTIYQSPIKQGSTQDSIQIYATSDDYNGNPQDLTIIAGTFKINRVG